MATNSGSTTWSVWCRHASLYFLPASRHLLALCAFSISSSVSPPREAQSGGPFDGYYPRERGLMRDPHDQRPRFWCASRHAPASMASAASTWSGCACVGLWTLEPICVRVLSEFGIAPALSCWLARTHHYAVHVHALFLCDFNRAWPSCAVNVCLTSCVRSVSSTVEPESKSSTQTAFLRLLDQGNLQSARALHFTSEAERDGLAISISILPLMFCHLVSISSSTRNRDSARWQTLAYTVAVSLQDPPQKAVAVCSIPRALIASS